MLVRHRVNGDRTACHLGFCQHPLTRRKISETVLKAISIETRATISTYPRSTLTLQITTDCATRDRASTETDTPSLKYWMQTTAHGMLSAMFSKTTWLQSLLVTHSWLLVTGMRGRKNLIQSLEIGKFSMKIVLNFTSQNRVVARRVRFNTL